MADARGNPFGFARTLDVPIGISSARGKYAALGYPPYEWAHYSDVPFQPLRKPLSDCQVALITTAAPFMPDKGDQGPGAPYNPRPSFSRPIPAMLSRIPICASAYCRRPQAYDGGRPGQLFPLAELRRSAEAGRIGSVAPRFHRDPDQSQPRAALMTDCPEVVARCAADSAARHCWWQTARFVTKRSALRHACEENGISTVVMGSAKDVDVQCRGFCTGFAGNRPARDQHSRVCALGLAMNVGSRACGTNDSGDHQPEVEG